MAKKIKNLGMYGTSKEAWDEAMSLSHIVVAANKANKKKHKLSVQRKGNDFILWLEQD